MKKILSISLITMLCFIWTSAFAEPYQSTYVYEERWNYAPPPPPHNVWTADDTAAVIVGGLAVGGIITAGILDSHYRYGCYHVPCCDRGYAPYLYNRPPMPPHFTGPPSPPHFGGPTPVPHYPW